jgi:hypothetical protein
MKEISNESTKDILSTVQSMGKHADETSVKDAGIYQLEIALRCEGEKLQAGLTLVEPLKDGEIAPW